MRITSVNAASQPLRKYCPLSYFFPAEKTWTSFGPPPHVPLEVGRVRRDQKLDRHGSQEQDDSQERRIMQTMRRNHTCLFHVTISWFHIYFCMAQIKLDCNCYRLSKSTSSLLILSSQLGVPLVAVTIRVFQWTLALVAVLGFLAPLSLERVGVVVMVVIQPRRALGTIHL